ncbi:MAG: helix-turn-helix domain-containing protein [Sedimentisphaerales bacterium]|nr:helix-turn-helix domain-containing protein [Sedimentisphaerales bacterium]
MSEANTPLMVGADEAAKLSGVSVRTWHNLRSQGKTPAEVRLAGRVLWRRSDLELWIEAGCPKREKFEQITGKGGRA